MKLARVLSTVYFSIFFLLGLIPLAISQDAVPGPTVIVYGINKDANTRVPPPPMQKPPRRHGHYFRGVQPQFTVTYTGFTTEARVAFQYAVDIWASQISSPVAIRVNARFVDLGGLNPDNSIDLGSASAPMKLGPNNKWYAEALADKLAGQDLDNRRADIRAAFNNHSDANWYFGTDGNTPSGKMDFVSIVLHELGHGLGFLAMGEPVDDKGTVRWQGFPGIYDSFVENGAGTDLTDTTTFPDPSAALLGQLSGGNLFWNGAKGVFAYGGTRPKLYAPSPWDNGSSYSHLDEYEFWAGNPNSLMTPFFRTAEAIHNPGPITLGILEDMGWTITPSPPPDPCTYTLSGSYESVSAAGASLQVDVQTTDDCEWTATSNSNFLSVAPSIGKGSDTVTITVRRNTGVARTGTLKIAGEEFTVDQDAYRPPPPPPQPIISDVCDRTSQVRNAIVRTSPVRTCADVTEEHLNAITSLNLAGYGITTLEQNDFDKLWSLERLYLAQNNMRMLPTGVFWYLTELTELDLGDNRLTTLDPQVFASLSNLESLALDGNQLTTLKRSIFNNLNNLTDLRLDGNQLTTLPIGAFKGLNKLTSLDLRNNPGSPLTFTLELVRTDRANLILQGPATVVVKLAQGAPFDMTVSLSVQRGTLSATTATITRGKTQSDPITVTKSGNSYTTVRLGTAPTVPPGYLGIQVAVGDSLVLFGIRPTPETVVKISGDTQRGYPGKTLENPFIVEVRDTENSVLEDIDVTFAITAGDGTLSETTVITDKNGRAESTLTLGSQSGKNTVRVLVEGISEPVIFNAEGVRTSTTLLKISGDTQQGYPGKALEHPLVVEVRDAENIVLEGIDVTFAVTAGDGTLSETTVTTNANGRAESMLTLGRQPGQNTVTVTVAKLEPVTFIAIGEAIPQTLTKSSGDEQRGLAGAQLVAPFVVEVRDQNNSAFPGVVVTFAVTAGDDTLSTTSTMTDANGRAESTLTLGPNPGTNTVSVSVAGIEEAVAFTAIGEIKFDLSVPMGISLIHVPLRVRTVDGMAKPIESVADLYYALGGAATVNLLITYDPKTQRWYSYLSARYKDKSADKALTNDLGIVASMKAPVSLRLHGDALGTNGSSSITLHPGTNLVGVPLKDSRITRVSDLLNLEGIEGNVSAIIVSNNGEFKVVARAGDDGDIQLAGGSSFLLSARATTTVAITGTGWSNPKLPPVGGSSYSRYARSMWDLRR